MSSRSSAPGQGSLALVDGQAELGAGAMHREFEQVDGGYALRQPTKLYA
jgi:hypothetical protein